MKNIKTELINDPYCFSGTDVGAFLLESSTAISAANDDYLIWSPAKSELDEDGKLQFKDDALCAFILLSYA